MIAVPTGEDPDDVWLVQMKAKDGFRSVGHSSSLTDPVDRGAMVPLQMKPMEPIEPGSRTYRAVPETLLKPGEYAVIRGGRCFDFGID